MTRLLEVTIRPFEDELRLRRLLCGKALPFRGVRDLVIPLGAGWKAEPSSLRQGD